jgi:hypothetical protein
VLAALPLAVRAQAPDGKEQTRPLRFTDITQKAGLEGVPAGRTCAWADYDGDGFVDLMASNGLFRNQGNGTFAKIQGVNGGEGLWADFNNDGNRDFLSLNGKGVLWLNRGDSRFRRAPFPGNPEPARPRAAAADANNDGLLDLYITNYEVKFGGPIRPDLLYIASAPATFKAPLALAGKDCWAARGANWADFDNDGDQDLYVSNYRLMPNALWVNNGDGTFADQAKARGVYGRAVAGREPASKWYSAYEYTGHTIGSSWGDINNDGNLDLIVVNFSHPPKFQNRVQVCINSGPPDYTFRNINGKQKAGIFWQESYAKGSLADADNDGDLDLYLTTVYPRDTGELFENDGTGHFKPIGEPLGVRIKNSYQINWADVDNDGNMDLMVGGRLFRNQGTGRNWLKVHAVGDAGSNRDAVGARIRVSAGDREQIREVQAGNSGNQDPFVCHFGLGNYTGNVTVKVDFPSGKSVTAAAAPNSLCTVRESDGEKR